MVQPDFTRLQPPGLYLPGQHSVYPSLFSALQAPHFKGYSFIPAKNEKELPQIHIFTPGTEAKKEDERVFVELPGRQRYEMRYADGMWSRKIELRPDQYDPTDPKTNMVHYRFHQGGQTRYDTLEVEQVGDEKYNRATPDPIGPQKPMVLADVFQDSILSSEQLKQRLKSKNIYELDRNFFNLLGGNEEGLVEMANLLKEKNVSGLLVRPLMGRDNISSHGYWTTDPYVISDKVTNRKALTGILQTLMQNDMKLFFDGAFVNQGVQGIQFWSNLYHGFQSPYWNWFAGNEFPKNIFVFPRLSYEKPSIGIVPTQINRETGFREPALDRVGVRLVNAPPPKEKANNPIKFLVGEPVFPKSEGYDPNKPTFVEFFNPQVEDVDGKLLPEGPKHLILSSKDSIQKYRFPVRSDDAADKLFQLSQKGFSGQQTAKAKVFTGAAVKELLEWDNFRITPDFKNDAGFEWDGQKDVLKINIHNPDTREYIGNALAFWTRYVRNEHLKLISEWLTEAKKGTSHATPAELIARITGNTAVTPPEKRLAEPKPATAYLENPEAIAANLEKYSVPLVGATPHALAKSLSHSFVHDYPIAALPLPNFYKAMVTIPHLQDRLEREWLPLPFRALGWVAAIPFTPLIWAAKKTKTGQKAIEQLDKLTPFRPPSFQDKLTKRMEEVIENLTPIEQHKLRHPLVQSILAQFMMQDVYLELLVNFKRKFGEDAPTPASLEDALVQYLPLPITKGSPLVAGRLLNRHLKERLDQGALDVPQLTEKIRGFLQGLDPDLINLANTIINTREYGLNWRLDATKDYLDKEQHFNTYGQKKFDGFLKDGQKLLDVWEKLLIPIRNIFPGTSIQGEVTSLIQLADPWGTPNHEQTNNVLQYRRFEDKLARLFTAFPDYALFNPPSSAVHSPGIVTETAEEGKSPRTVFDRIFDSWTWNEKQAKWQKSAQFSWLYTIPWYFAKSRQAMTTNHDLAGIAHTFMLHTGIFDMDYRHNLGMKDEFTQKVQAMLEKPCFPEMAKLSPDEQVFLREALEIVKQANEGKALGLNDRQATLFQNDSKANYFQWHVPNDPRPTTFRDDKVAFVDQVVSKVIPLKPDVKAIETQILTPIIQPFMVAANGQPYSILDTVNSETFWDGEHAKYPQVSPEEWTTLKRSARVKATLMNRFLDYSELEAYRGLLNNGLLSLKAKPEEMAEIFHAFDLAGKEYGRMLGYKPVEFMLTQVFDKTDRSVISEARAEELKGKLFDFAMQPVLDKLERMIAIQVALPGNPSLYLQDFFAQSGSELQKNAYVQNRQLIRQDRIDPKNKAYLPYLDQHLKRVADILALRAQYRVLNDGFMGEYQLYDENGAGITERQKQYTEDLNQSGVLPFFRYNVYQDADGTQHKEEVVMLVNTGKPEQLNHKDDKENRPLILNNSPLYPYSHMTQPVAKDYQLDAEALRIPPGTVFEVLAGPDKGKHVTVGKDGKLDPINFEKYTLLKKLPAGTHVVRSHKLDQHG